MGENGAEILFAEKYALNAEGSTLTVLAFRIKKAPSDALLIDVQKNGAGILLKRLYELAVKTRFLATHKVREAFKLGLVPQEISTQDIWVLDLPVAPQFRELFLQTYKEEPDLYADSAYDCLMLLAYAAEHSDGSGLKARAILREMRGYVGISGVFTFDSNGDNQRARWYVSKLAD